MNKRIKAIEAQVANYNGLLEKMTAAMVKLTGEDREIVTAQCNALVDYVEALQAIVDAFGKEDK